MLLWMAEFALCAVGVYGVVRFTSIADDAPSSTVLPCSLEMAAGHYFLVFVVIGSFYGPRRGLWWSLLEFVPLSWGVFALLLKANADRFEHVRADSFRKVVFGSLALAVATHVTSLTWWWVLYPLI